MSTRVLAEYFAQAGWTVIWLTPPLRPWYRLRHRRTEILDQHRSGGLRYCDGHVFAYTPFSLAPHTLRLPVGSNALARRLWRWCVPPLERVLRRAGLDAPDVIWLSHMFGLGLPRLFPGTPVIWQIADDYAERSSRPRRTRSLCQLNFRLADLLLFSSPLVAEKIRSEYGVKHIPYRLLPHAIDAWRLQPPSGEDPLKHVPRPRVVYVGNTTQAHPGDFAALARSGRCEVIVIGEAGPLGLSRDLPRLHLLGPRPRAEVGRLLGWCDVGLVSYSDEVLVWASAGSNPMKTYEYAAAGLPILAPRMRILEALDVPVHVFDDEASLGAQLDRVLSDLPALGAKAKAWVAEQSWDRRFGEAEAAVLSLLQAPQAAR